MATLGELRSLLSCLLMTSAVVFSLIEQTSSHPKKVVFVLQEIGSPKKTSVVVTRQDEEAVACEAFNDEKHSPTGNYVLKTLTEKEIQNVLKECASISKTRQRRQAKGTSARNCTGEGCSGKNCTGASCGAKNCTGENCSVKNCTGARCGAKNCTGDDSNTKNCTGASCAAKNCTGDGCNIKNCTGVRCGAKNCTGEDCSVKNCTGARCGAKNCTGEDCSVKNCKGTSCATKNCTGDGCRTKNCTGEDCSVKNCMGANCGANNCTGDGCRVKNCTGAGCDVKNCTGEGCGVGNCSGESCDAKDCGGSGCGEEDDDCDDGSCEQDEESSADEETMWNIIFPGTRWCGSGQTARNFDDLGYLKSTDACCRSHDNCDDTMAPGETKHNLTNDSRFTSLSCACDDEFYACLSSVNSFASNTIGRTYFNVLRRNCYTKAHPHTNTCKTYRSFLKITCKEYEKNTSVPEVYMWKSPKRYRKLPIPLVG